MALGSPVLAGPTAPLSPLIPSNTSNNTAEPIGVSFVLCSGWSKSNYVDWVTSIHNLIFQQSNQLLENLKEIHAQFVAMDEIEIGKTGVLDLRVSGLFVSS